MEDVFNFDVSLIANSDSAENAIYTISDSLTDILKSQFPGQYQKQQYKVGPHDINFACPYCGDSATDLYKKRGHFLLDGKFAGHYKCFNCGKYTSIIKFFKDFKKDLDLNSVNYLVDTSNNSSLQKENYQNSDFFDKEKIKKYGIPKAELQKRLNLLPISKDGESAIAYRYLISRAQYDFNKFLYDAPGKWLVILNIVDDIVIGFQCRDLSRKRKAKYNTFNLSRMHAAILKDDVMVPSNLDNLSITFNIFDINPNKPVLATEGPLDSFLLNNCIATAGANRNIILPMQIYWIYDSDETGRKHSIEKLEEKQFVFLWDKLLSDMNIPVKKKWDINDLIIYMKRYRPNERIEWMKYFSNDIFDIIDI